MNLLNQFQSKRLRLALLTLTAVAASTELFAAVFSEWQNRQEFVAETPGLIKVSLPVETIDAARAGLEDLRILDPRGNEVSYAIERPTPVGRADRRPESFAVSLKDNSSVLTIKTGTTLPLEGVTLHTPAESFIKAVRVEAANDQANWQLLAEGQAIFLRSGANRLRLPLSGTWAWLRLTVSDRRSTPIPFTGATIHLTGGPAVPNEPLTISISERVENPGQTRLVLNFGAANLDLASLRFETAEPLFMRQVTLAVPEVSENAIREQTLTQGVIFRVEVDGQPRSIGLDLPVEMTVPSRELVALIQNDNSPPLQISSISGERRPVHVVLMAHQSGTYAVLSGNKRATAPRYDLGALGPRFKHLPPSRVKLTAMGPNPDYRPHDTLPEIQEMGASLDVAGWRFRKPLQLTRAGVQQVELDLAVLAHSAPDLSDLRLVLGGKQVPYIVEHPSISRPLAVTATKVIDTAKPTWTRWRLKLPLPKLPLERLVCQSSTPLFQREVRLFELAADERGREYERDLGRASWVQTPDRKTSQFALALSCRPSSDILLFETDNGDNPPVEMTDFKFYYPATRLLFKSAAAGIDLYYANPDANAPRYDLSLVAAQILSSDKTAVAPGPQEQLKRAGWSRSKLSANRNVIFWVVLGVVVAGLLLLISRLLPTPDSDKPNGSG